MTTPGPPRTVVTPPGHDLDVWAPTLAASPRVAVADLAEALSPGPGPTALVVVGAHPDDETLGLGRLAHLWGRQVGPVTGVTATRGEACVDHVRSRPAGLADRRIREWHQALDRLGFTDRQVLDLPDAQVAVHEDTLVGRLSEILTGQLRTGPTVLAAPWRSDPHPDHRAVGRATARVADSLGLPMVEYGVWMTYWGDPASVGDCGRELVVVVADPEAELACAEATRAFTSQLVDLDPTLTPVLPAAMLAHQAQQLVILDPAVAAAARTVR